MADARAEDTLERLVAINTHKLMLETRAAEARAARPPKLTTAQELEFEIQQLRDEAATVELEHEQAKAEANAVFVSMRPYKGYEMQTISELDESQNQEEELRERLRAVRVSADGA